jgi:hypothetical protein
MGGDGMYMILVNRSAMDLSAKVREYCEQGYKPVGGPVFVPGLMPEEGEVWQAMISQKDPLQVKNIEDVAGFLSEKNLEHLLTVARWLLDKQRREAGG